MYFAENDIYSSPVWEQEPQRVQIIQQQEVTTWNSCIDGQVEIESGSTFIIKPRDAGNTQQVPQQPATIIQQLPPPQQPQIPPIRNGHMKEELVELMMIQNAQMHQVIMNNITMAALSSFGYNTQPQYVKQNPISIRMEESEPDTVCHHHYESWPYPSYPPWPTLPPQVQPQTYHTMRLPQESLQPAVRHISRDGPPNPRREFQAVPPPPPPSATGTVGADVLPVSEYYDLADGQI